VAPADDWCQQNVMSVGRADRQQEQEAPGTSYIYTYTANLYTNVA